MIYKDNSGNPNAPSYYLSSEGIPLGEWQDFLRELYKKRLLPIDRIERLNEIGFKWQIGRSSDDAFERGLQETKKYKEQFSSPNAPSDYIAPEGYRLGEWQAHQRRKYNKGKLLQDRIHRLEKIDFNWTPLENNFNKGFQKTLKFREQTGDPNVPKNTRSSLYNWQCRQRRLYNHNKLSTEQIKNLEKIGFKWIAQNYSSTKEYFETGFNETLQYKKLMGNSNAFQNYKAPEGFDLGAWQNQIRQQYKEGKLSLDEINRLSKIRFKWELKKK